MNRNDGASLDADAFGHGAMTSRCLMLITLHYVPERHAHGLSLMLRGPLNYSSSILAPKST